MREISNQRLYTQWWITCGELQHCNSVSDLAVLTFQADNWGMLVKGPLKVIGVFVLIGALIFTTWLTRGFEASWASVRPEGVGYERAFNSNENNNIPIAAGGYTSLNPQIFLEGRQNLRLLADSITYGLESDLEKAAAISKWVFIHVRPQTAAPPVVIGDDFWNILRRGWGFCDQMAHVYAAIATYADLPSRQLQLFRAGYGSPHTLAESLIDGEWVIVATWRGFVPLDGQGKPMTKEKLANSDSIKLFEGLNPQDFLDAVPFYSYPYAPTKTIFERIFNRVRGRLSNLINPSESNGKTKDDSEVAPSSTPTPIINTKTKDLKSLDDGRRAHLKLEYQRAIGFYDTVIRTEDLGLKYQAKFWKTVAFFDSGDFTEAKNLIEQYGGDFRDPYRISYLRLLAEIYLKQGFPKEAKSVLELMDTPQSRADLLRLTPKD